MNASKHTLIYHTCQCCKESYSSKEDADRCCSELSEDTQEDIWERRLDLFNLSISVFSIIRKEVGKVNGK